MARAWFNSDEETSKRSVIGLMAADAEDGGCRA